QKFLGKVLLGMGDVQGALQALEAADFLSPEDGEVEKLLESVRQKATLPTPVEFSPGVRAEEETGQILTYEIKSPEAKSEAPVHPPVPEEAGGDDAVFHSGASPGPAIPEPSMEGEDLEFGEDEEISSGPEDSGDENLTEEEDFIEELGLEAVAFLEDAEEAQEDVEIVAEEGELPPTVEAPPPDISGETAKETADRDGSREEETLKSAGLRDSMDPFAVLNRRSRPIVVEPPSFTSTQLAGPGLKASAPLIQGREEKLPLTPPWENAAHPEESPGENDVSSGNWEGIPIFEKPAAPAPDPVKDPADVAKEDLSTETLADLYARQGLREKAADIYRKILVQRPGDNGILEKLRALEGKAAGMDIPRQVGGNPEADEIKKDPASARDPLEILERWLENAERMKNNDL
ncbi:MAG: hypothetical protein JXR72_03410, partial [Proteobacteria bacterium]|nr:hypothetical protein [Pseudomonadota bacterium]